MEFLLIVTFPLRNPPWSRLRHLFPWNLIFHMCKSIHPNCPTLLVDYSCHLIYQPEHHWDVGENSRNTLMVIGRSSKLHTDCTWGQDQTWIIGSVRHQHCLQCQNIFYQGHVCTCITLLLLFFSYCHAAIFTPNNSLSWRTLTFTQFEWFVECLNSILKSLIHGCTMIGFYFSLH